MDEKRSSPDCQECISGELFHVGEVSGMMDILECLARGCVVLKTVQKAQRHESIDSAIGDIVAGDGGFGFKRMMECLGYDSSRSCADKSIAVWEGGRLGPGSHA